MSAFIQPVESSIIKSKQWEWSGHTASMPGGINQTENPRRWDRVGERESEYGNTTVVLPYGGHQMLNFTLI